jgi:hypothetical protein
MGPVGVQRGAREDCASHLIDDDENAALVDGPEHRRERRTTLSFTNTCLKCERVELFCGWNVAVEQMNRRFLCVHSHSGYSQPQVLL